MSVHSRTEYTVGWVSALPEEHQVAQALLESTAPALPALPGDSNIYVLGRIGGHNVVLVCLGSGDLGPSAAAAVVGRLFSTFTKIRFCLVVGIGGGVPEPHGIRLGDVVVSTPSGENRGFVNYDFGKTVGGGVFQHRRALDGPPPVLLKSVTQLRSSASLDNRVALHLSTVWEKLGHEFAYPGDENDRLFASSYIHPSGSKDCQNCDQSKISRLRNTSWVSPKFFYGTVGCGSQVIMDAVTRDRLARQYDLLCFEMEAGGLANNFPCLAVRGISDYADSHKNDKWKKYAAASAGAFARELLMVIPPEQVEAISAERPLFIGSESIRFDC